MFIIIIIIISFYLLNIFFLLQRNFENCKWVLIVSLVININYFYDYYYYQIVFHLPGVYAASFDNEIEWLIVKGVSSYVCGAELTGESWEPFASVMAASLVAHILSEPGIFAWPNYAGTMLMITRRRFCLFFSLYLGVNVACKQREGLWKYHGCSVNV